MLLLVLQVYVVFPHVESSAASPLRECNASAVGHGTEQAIRERPRYTNRKRLQRKSPSFGSISGTRGLVRSMEEGLEHQGDEHRGVPAPEAGSSTTGFQSS